MCTKDNLQEWCKSPLSNQQNPKNQAVFLPLECPDFINSPKDSPLKIRGAKGSYENYGSNPLYPPYFKGEI